MLHRTRPARRGSSLRSAPQSTVARRHRQSRTSRSWLDLASCRGTLRRSCSGSRRSSPRSDRRRRPHPPDRPRRTRRNAEDRPWCRRTRPRRWSRWRSLRRRRRTKTSRRRRGRHTRKLPSVCPRRSRSARPIRRWCRRTPAWRRAHRGALSLWCRSPRYTPARGGARRATTAVHTDDSSRTCPRDAVPSRCLTRDPRPRASRGGLHVPSPDASTPRMAPIGAHAVAARGSSPDTMCKNTPTMRSTSRR